MRRLGTICISFVMALTWILGFSVVGWSDVPHEMNYQGFLKDNSTGEPVHGLANFQFSLHSDSTGGTLCWGPEPHFAVQVKAGLFEVQLGDSIPLPDSCFDGSEEWLEIWVNGAPLSPRKPILSSAYAFRSPSTQGQEPGIGGAGTQNFVAKFADSMTIGDSQIYDDGTRVGIGTTSPAQELDVNGNVSASAYFGDGSNLTGIASSLKTYDSGWFSVGSSTTYFLVHNLGTTRAIFQLYGATDSSGGNMSGAWAAWEGNDGQQKHSFIGQITPTTCAVRTGIHAPCACWNGSEWQAATHMRVVAVALE